MSNRSCNGISRLVNWQRMVREGCWVCCGRSLRNLSGCNRKLERLLEPQRYALLFSYYNVLCLESIFHETLQMAYRLRSLLRLRPPLPLPRLTSIANHRNYLATSLLEGTKKSSKTS